MFNNTSHMASIEFIVTFHVTLNIAHPVWQEREVWTPG